MFPDDAVDKLVQPQRIEQRIKEEIGITEHRINARFNQDEERLNVIEEKLRRVI
jgi:archaellum component FlaC